MELYKLPEDIKTLYVKATSFPAGILAAYQQLEQKLGSVNGRTFFGLSRMEDGCGIVYMAAAQEAFDGEGAQLGLETHIIPKGTYLTQTVSNWRGGNEFLIGQSFEALLKDSRLDADSYCVEWYQENDDVLCMVKLMD